MNTRELLKWKLNRRKLLKAGAGMAIGSSLASTLAAPPIARAAGGKVIIGAFADGGLTPFKQKIIPLAKSEAGFDVQYLEDEYGVTLEKWFADAQNRAGQYDIYLLDDPWVPQFGAADVLEDLGAGGIDASDPDWIASLIAMGYWPPRQGARVKGFEDATPKLISLPFVGDLQTLTYRNDVYANGAPATWDELIAKGKEGVAAGKIKYPIVFRGVSGNPIVTSWYPIFLSFGGQFFDDKWNVTFNSDAGKAAADFFVGTMKQNAPPGVVEFDSDQEGASILGGEAGAIIQYSGNALKADDPEADQGCRQARLRRRAEAGEGDRPDRHLHRLAFQNRHPTRPMPSSSSNGTSSPATQAKLAEAGSIPVRRSAFAVEGSGQPAHPGGAAAARRRRRAAAAHARLGQGRGAARHRAQQGAAGGLRWRRGARHGGRSR